MAAAWAIACSGDMCCGVPSNIPVRSSGFRRPCSPRARVPPRSLEVRITEYRDALRVTADDIQRMLNTLPPAANETEHDARVGLQTVVDLHRTMADDISKIIAGEELEGWAIAI